MDSMMQQLSWPYFGRGLTGQLGAMHFPKQGKEGTVKQRIPKIIGKGYFRPKSVDALTLALQNKMNGLTISASNIHILKRPVSSTPTLSSSKCRTDKFKTSDTFSTTDELSSIASNDSEGNFPRSSSEGSHTSADTNSESDDSRGVGKRMVGESYPKFNINTHNAVKIMHTKEKIANQKEACGFLRCAMSELERKERAEELSRKRAKTNATFNREQTRQIERENQILLQKLIRVEQKGKRIPLPSAPSILSNRRKEMEKESRRIRLDNARLYMKIKFARPSEDLLRASELG